MVLSSQRVNMIKNIHRQYQKNKFCGGITLAYLPILNTLEHIMEIQPARVEKVVLPLLCLARSDRAYISGQLPGGV